MTQLFSAPSLSKNWSLYFQTKISYLVDFNLKKDGFPRVKCKTWGRARLHWSVTVVLVGNVVRHDAS